jgi:CRP-like cAMP-binding protein
MIRHDDLRRLIYGNPTLCHLLWRETLVDAAIHREWLMVTGRMVSRSRIAHFFCEMLLKHQAAGLASGSSFRLPLTQTEISDALGLTPVHVNRVLQELRTDGLIQLGRAADTTIVDLERLQDEGAFDQTYLHMDISEAV